MTFAYFFKSYAIGIGLIAASIPLLTNLINGLPIYASMTKTLSVGTTMICYLAIAVLFSWRFHMSEAVFPSTPGDRISRKQNRKRQRYRMTYTLSLIVFVALSLSLYLIAMRYSLRLIVKDNPQAIETMQTILLNTPLFSIPYLFVLMGSYIAMFLTMATVFVWIGLIDYVQVARGITDADLLNNPYQLMATALFEARYSSIDNILLFSVEYDPKDHQNRHLHGPLCFLHHKQLHYSGNDATDKGQYEWRCRRPFGFKRVHSVFTSLDLARLQKYAEEKAEALLRNG